MRGPQDRVLLENLAGSLHRVFTIGKHGRCDPKKCLNSPLHLCMEKSDYHGLVLVIRYFNAIVLICI